MLCIVKLVPLILLSHWKSASLLVLTFIVEVSLLIRKSLKALGASLMVGLLLSVDSTNMTCYDIAVIWLVRAIVNQLQVRYFDVHLNYNFSYRSPQLSVDFKWLLMFLILQSQHSILLITYFLAVHYWGLFRIQRKNLLFNKIWALEVKQIFVKTLDPLCKLMRFR